MSPRIPTARPGQWRRENVSALCRPGGPLEALDDPAAETVVITKGSQTALTTTAYCWLAKAICTDPSSALVVMNSTQDARDKSSETWRPMWEDSPHLKRHLPASRRKDWTKLFQLVNRAPIYWVGANSAGRLGSKPIRRLILDEVDKYPQKFGGEKNHREAGAAALAEQRTKTFRQSGLAKILKFSTPTMDTGDIWRAFEQGDRRQLYVKCHACRAEQIMTWPSFKLDMDLAKTDPGAAVAGCHYECTACAQPWTDAQRWAAIDAGVWKPTIHARDPKCRSFQLPSWCSKMVSAQYLGAQWIKAQETTSALQDFINSECGEPFRHYDTQIRDELFAALEGEYREGETFADCPVYKPHYAGTPDRFVFGGVDVQKGYLVAVFRQFVQGGDSGLVWGGDVSSFEAVEELAEKFGARLVMMDQRYRQREVQEWAFANTGYIPTMGVTTKAKSLFTVNSLDLDEGRSSRTGQRVIETLGYDADQLKDILATQIQRGQGARRWLIPAGYAGNSKYCQQMTAERCVNGRWINPGQRANHFFDAEALTLLAAIRFEVWGYYNATQGGIA
jgi:phage terminase large subunit GpA-like protein